MARVPIKELRCGHGFGVPSFFTWCSKFGGVDILDAKRLKAVEHENARLKELLAETLLDKEALEGALRRKY